MNNNIFQLNKLLLLGVNLIGLILLILPSYSQAVSVAVTQSDTEWRYRREFKIGGCSGPPDFKADTTFTMSLSKEFNLSSTNLGNLNSSETRVLRPGETLTAYNNLIGGSYNYTSGDKATPPFDGQDYSWNYRSERGDCDGGYEVQNLMRGGASTVGYTLSSSDSSIIDCTGGQSCSVKDKNGSATITVSFPDTGSFYVQRAYQFGYTGNWLDEMPATIASTTTVSCGRGCSRPRNTYTCPSGWDLVEVDTSDGYYYLPYGNPYCERNIYEFRSNGGATASSSFTYRLSNIAYSVTVQKPDNPPTISNITAAAVGYNDANIAWTYSDADGDAQTWWSTRISTTQSFNPKDIVVWSGEPQTGSAAGAGARTSNNTSSDFFTSNRGRLKANTTYYTRVNVGNAKAETGWVNGPSFRTQAYPQSVITFNVEDIGSVPDKTTDAERLKFTWSITNIDGVASCTASTGVTGGASTANLEIWKGNKPIVPAVPPNGPGGTINTQEIQLPWSQITRDYTFTLSCATKPQGGGAGAMTIAPVTLSPLRAEGRVVKIKLEAIVGVGKSKDDLRQGDSVDLKQITYYNTDAAGNPIPVNNLRVLNVCDKSLATNTGVSTGIIEPSPVPARRYFLESINTPQLRQISRNNTTFGVRINPDLRTNTEFTFTSNCSPVDGPRPIATAQVTANPKPLISCNLTNKVISEDNTNIQVNLQGDSAWSTIPGQAPGQGYRWFIDKGVQPENFESVGAGDNKFKFSQGLDYSNIFNLGLNKYTVRARLEIGSIQSDNTVCTNGPVTSLGDRTIREVAP